MAFSPSSPITGAAQTGFTSPTYTFVADVAPDVNGKQNAITALGGTQTGVTAHSVSSPFTQTFTRPRVVRGLPAIGVNGQYSNVPNNTYKLLSRKGVLPAANQVARVMLIDTSFSIPAGSDTYDAANIRAALSAHIGVLTQIAASLGDTLVTGVM